MRIMLATLLMNEMEWLRAGLFEQHAGWPDTICWAFVEAADVTYAKTNPEMVTDHGLSVDGTTEYLRALAADRPGFVRHIQVGFFGAGTGGDPMHAKGEARNHYLRLADELEPDWIVQVDGDEFYAHEDQRRIVAYLAQFTTEPRPPVLFRQRYPWWPSSSRDSGRHMFEQEVVGGYFSVPHLRVWPWYRGMRHLKNHNWPQLPDGSTSLRDRMVRMDRIPTAPECVHLAFASSLKNRSAKHRYYENRGEALDPSRARNVACRAAWETWVPGEKLPNGAQVIPYTGSVPEVLR